MERSLEILEGLRSTQAARKRRRAG